MIDISKTIEAKSDQLNADDLLGGPRIIKITEVKAGKAEQPINIYYEGDRGKPWKPSKGMRRVLVAAWGVNGEDYVGRYVELFNDQSVKWAGEEVGGIRIAGLSDIENMIMLPITLSRGRKKAMVIKKLDPQKIKKEITIEERRIKTIALISKTQGITPEIEALINDCNTAEELKSIFDNLQNQNNKE